MLTRGRTFVSLLQVTAAHFRQPDNYIALSVAQLGAAAAVLGKGCGHQRESLQEFLLELKVGTAHAGGAQVGKTYAILPLHIYRHIAVEDIASCIAVKLVGVEVDHQLHSYGGGYVGARYFGHTPRAVDKVEIMLAENHEICAGIIFEIKEPFVIDALKAHPLHTVQSQCHGHLIWSIVTKAESGGIFALPHKTVTVQTDCAIDKIAAIIAKEIHR